MHNSQGSHGAADASAPRRRRRWLPWVLVATGAAAALIVVGGIVARNTGVFGLFRVATCDAWSITLRDGTLLTPPPEALVGIDPSEYGEGFGPCWDLPGWVSWDDVHYSLPADPPPPGPADTRDSR